MKTGIVWLLLGLAALTIPFSEALFCYDCVIGETDEPLDDGATCMDPMTPSETTTCEGAACLITWSDYGSQGNATSFTCLTETFGYSGPFTVDLCLNLNAFQDTHQFYIDDDMCCYTANKTMNYSNGSSIQYTEKTCGCDEDYCNRNTAASENKSPAGYVEYTTAITTMTADADNATGANMTSFANHMRSNWYIYGFTLIVANVIIVLPLE